MTKSNPLESKSFMRNSIGDINGIERVSDHGKYARKQEGLPNLHSFLAMIDTRPKASFDQLMRAFAIAGYSIEQVISGSRKREIVAVRYALIHHLINTVTPKLSLDDIGMIVGGRNHSTIIHARDSMKDLADVGQDGPIAEHVMNIAAALRNVKHADELKIESTTLTTQTNTDKQYAIRYSFAS